MPIRLLLPASFLLLASCASTGADRAPPPRPEQASLLVPCDDPVALPERALSDQDVEILWGRDRAALRVCGNRHRALTGRGPATPQ